MSRSLPFVAALAALLASSVSARADDPAPAPKAAPATPGTLEFGDGIAKFRVHRDLKTGRMTFRLTDPAVRVDRAPVIVLPAGADPREVTLVPVEGHEGEWYWSSDLVKGARFDGTMRILVGGRPYTSSLASVWASATTEEAKEHLPRYGGRVLTLTECGVCVEVVQDPARGVLTVYSFDDVAVEEAPVVTVSEAKGPTQITLTKMDGKEGAWTATNDAFKASPVDARIQLPRHGKGCEAPIAQASPHGGRLVTVVGGPTFEVVRDPKEGYYTFYAVDETYEGKTYEIERPTVVVGSRTYELVPVADQRRAWRLIGLDANGTDQRDAQLNFTLFGKTLSTRLGLSGFGLGVR